MSVANRWRFCAAAVLAAAIAAPVAAQLIGPGGVLQGPPGGGGIGGPLGGRIGDTVDSAGDTVGGIVEPIEEEVEEAVEVVDETVEAAVDEIERIAAAATELFLAGEDASGQPSERDIWVVLVPEEFAEQIPGWGFTIRERRALEGLDLVLLRIEAPDDRSMTETELELSSDAPGTIVDFNHVYGPSQQEGAGSIAGSVNSASPPARGLAPAGTVVPPSALRFGLVDSAIATDHEAFEDIAIVQQDFVPYQGERPRLHGTAVASIGMEVLRARAGDNPLGLFAASVFFVDDEGETTATTGSLVAALDWLGGQELDVINMSLTGPPNRVLEAALAATARQGTVVVAAVGNDGPAARPLYPAAYDSVLGITAVDSEHRAYRHANRGSQVSFAAPGVRVRVARANGGYDRESGTSMAAPVAAAVIASALAKSENSPEQTLQRLEREAIDLGSAGFDEIYGHGLIATAE